jgi:hypothetical protein
VVIAILDARAGEVIVHCGIRLANTRVWRRHVDTAVEVLVQVGEYIALIAYFIGPFLVAAVRTSMVGEVVSSRGSSECFATSIVCSSTLDAGLWRCHESPVDKGLSVVWIRAHELGCA